ncbi:unnamed protein product [Amoebophrya sp. A120]|nr:unnamed protein product [Amoebophrya sp. A120]|eukprot:GSA120T00004734001.1
MASLLPGMSQLITKLEEIQVACGEKEDPENKKQRAKQDDYTIMKRQLHGMLHILRTNIRERNKITKKHGNNYQAIQKKVRIMEQISEIEKYLPKLQQIQMKQAKAKRLPQEEIDFRIQDIRNIVKQLEEAKIALQSNVDVAEDEFDEGEDDVFGPGTNSKEKNATANLLEHRYQLERDQTGRDLNEDEQQAIQRWKDRDENFDQMLDQIGVLADRLNPLVSTIGEAAQRQSIIANDISKKTEKADEDIKTMGGKLKYVLQQERNSDFICKLIMFLVLLTVMGVLAKMLNSQMSSAR